MNCDGAGIKVKWFGTARVHFYFINIERSSGWVHLSIVSCVCVAVVVVCGLQSENATIRFGFYFGSFCSSLFSLSPSSLHSSFTTAKIKEGKIHRIRNHLQQQLLRLFAKCTHQQDKDVSLRICVYCGHKWKCSWNSSSSFCTVIFIVT